MHHGSSCAMNMGQAAQRAVSHEQYWTSPRCFSSRSMVA
jgi:hypothetical protein